MNICKEKSALIVDDQPNWRLVLKTLLIQEGFQVSEASGYSQAKEILRLGFHLVIIDLRLVNEEIFNVEGLALVRYIKSISPNTRIILITGYPQSLSKTNHNADALLLKVPEGSYFDINEFKKIVKDLIN